MSEWSTLDWCLYLGVFVVLPLVMFAYNRWQEHRTYSEIRRHTERIGKDDA